MAEGLAPIEIFCCYAREDETWLRKLETHLSLLKQQGLISLWHDRFIFPGMNWAQEIDAHLETASVILLLVSADFFASDYYYGIEMQRALERHAAGEARVVPILTRPVDWKGAPFAHLRVLPTDAKPITSWQSKDRALADVAAGIRRVIEDVPLLAASTPRAALPPIWNIPYQRNTFFLGRESELAQVRQRLQTGQMAALSQPQAISGLGGIGKTQLALEYAYRYHQDYQAVLWARAENTDTLISSYVAIASLLRLPEREDKEQGVIVQAVKTWLQMHRDWLLILDNADDLPLLPDFLPPSLGGHLLLTTRAAATGRLAQRLEIATLQPEQGALFLLRRAALLTPDATLEEASTQEWELALRISQELGSLPLALDQAGAYLEETGMDLAGYWSLYQQHRADLLQERGGLVADHPLPVATIWSVSFQRVEERNPHAAELLRLVAFLAPDVIPEEILTTGVSQLGPVLALVAADALLFNRAIDTLRAYSLVQRHPKEKSLSVHRLVQAVLQDQLVEKERLTWAERAMHAINAAFPDPEYPTWPQCERLLPQAVTAAHTIEQYQLISEGAGRLLYKMASYLQDRGRYGEAELLYQRTLRIYEQMFGPEHPLTAYPRSGLAGLYAEQDKYEQAEPLYQWVLRTCEQQLGPEHPDVASSLNSLAGLYAEQGKYEQAEPLIQRALHIWEQQLGPEHPDVTKAFNSLAGLYAEQGKYEQAEPLFQRALHLREQQLGPEHPDVAMSLNNLALLYVKQDEYEQAEPLFQRALHIREQQLDPEHPYLASSLHNLATIYLKQGKYEQAEPLFQQALRIYEQTLGAHHPHTIQTRENLVILLRARGQHEQAAQIEANQFEL